jgi:hypothetical protein
MSDQAKTSDPMVAALLRERDGLVQRGLDDRIAQVDEQLALRGYSTADASTGASEDPPQRSDAKEEPKGRQARPRTKAAE